MNPFHLWMIFLLNLEIAYVCPPLGLKALGIAIDRRRPPVQQQHPIAVRQHARARERRVEQLRGSAECVGKEERLAETHEEVDLVSREERRDPSGGQGLPRGHKISGIARVTTRRRRSAPRSSVLN